MLAGKLLIKCDNFKENTCITFESLRKERDFADVTLVCEDGQQVEAHKVILAASSPFFQDLLKRIQHPHPLIFMRNVSSENLEAMIDFLYLGEARLLEGNLQAFLDIAQELKLKGLSGEKEDMEIGTEGLHSRPKARLEDIIKEEQNIEETKAEEHGQVFKFEDIGAISNDFSELPRNDEDIESMMEKSGNMISNGKDKSIHTLICKTCGKEGRRRVIKKHIRANHLGTACNLCGQKFVSKSEGEKHKTNHQDCKKKLELKERVNSLMGKSETLIPNGKHSDGRGKNIFASICKVCGKEGRFKNIRGHIEMSHL